MQRGPAFCPVFKSHCEEGELCVRETFHKNPVVPPASVFSNISEKTATMASNSWKIWRFCVACQAKFQGSVETLQFGHRSFSSENPRELSFYLECGVCGTVNLLEAALIPDFLQEMVKKEFYRQRKKPRKKSF